jgi:hypothetical protein
MKSLPRNRFIGAGSLALLLALAVAAPAAERNPISLQKDTNPDTKVHSDHKRSDAEKDARRMTKEQMRADAEKKHAAELLKKFDTNHDGVLDATEQAALDAFVKAKQNEKKKQGA